MAVRAETQIDLARVDDGTPGVSPTATVTKSGDTATITITDANQTTTASVSDGTDGTNGVSVTAVEPQYYLSTSDSSATGGSWSSTPATFVSGYYYWTRDYITFSDGTHDTSTEVYNAGMTQAAQDAYDAKTLADDTNQYFWYAPTGADTGAHITEVPQDEWNDSSDPNYHSGGNLLARSTGIAVRDGMDELATFSASGARIGQVNETHVEIDEDSFLMFDSNGTKFAHIGSPSSEEITDTFVYSSGNQFVLSSTPSGSVTVALNETVLTLNVDYTLSPSGIITLIIQASPGDVITATYTISDQLKYYTFGTRLGNSGEYSIAEGCDTTSSGFGSHAEGWKTIASGPRSHAEGDGSQALGFDSHAEGVRSISSGPFSHAEGYETQAIGDTSHAEGSQSKARGSNAHAEGLDTQANGNDSHTSGHATIADYNAQTVIGKYNDNNSSTAFEIGNGSSYNDRSNAFTVDWSGNIVASGTLRASNETPTASVTASTGTLISATAKRFGNVVQLLVTVQNSSSIAQGGNIFEGTLSTTALRPLMTTTTGSYYSTSAITATLATDGSIVIRNEGGSKSFTSNVNVSFTYIVA